MKARRVFKDPEELGKKKKMQKQKELKHEMLEQEDEKEQAMLKFLLDQHEWIKKRFDEISPAPSSLEVPEFPKWMIKEEEKEKESEKEESEEEEPVGKKKKSLKRKREAIRKGKGKKKANEEEWLEEESTEEEEDPELKEMEKETEEENTTTEGSDNADEIDDFDLGLSLEEILRKKKAKSPVLEQIDPSETPSKAPSPKSSEPPSTGTTPPPPEKTTQEKEPETEPTKIPTPPIDQPKEKSPPTQEDTPIISTDIISETGTMQDLNESPKEKEATGVKEEKNAEISEETGTEASAPGASAPEQQPAVTEPVMNKIDETLNIVITQLAEKRRQELGNTQKFFKKSTGSLLGKATKQQEFGETMKEKVTGEEQKATAAGTATTAREEATLKDVAETLADLPGQVLKEPAKETEVQGSAQAPEASAPDSDEVVDITPSQQPASGSKTPKGKKQKKPKQTPTRSSSRLRSGAKPQ